MTRGREPSNVRTNFRDDDLCGATTDAGDRVQSLQHHLKSALTFSDLGAQSLNGLVQEVGCAPGPPPLENAGADQPGQLAPVRVWLACRACCRGQTRP